MLDRTGPLVVRGRSRYARALRLLDPIMAG